MKDDNGNYFIRSYLNGSAPVNNLTYKVMLEDEIIYSSSLSMTANSVMDLPIIPLDDGDKGVITVSITNVAGVMVNDYSVGVVDIGTEEDNGMDGTEWIIGGLFILGAIILVVILFLFNRPKDEGEYRDASIEGIGGSRKFDYRTRERSIRGGPLPERETRGRRAPPPPRERPTRGRRL
jgi:hypothetical protein